jgi:putative endonuclease
MATSKKYYVYIMTNTHHTVLYTGVKNSLQRRELDHESGVGSAFTKKYDLQILVFFEIGNDIDSAIAGAKQIKGGSRQNKIELIISVNPEWKDLYKELFM